MKVDTSRVGLVRGYVIYSQWGAGCVGMEQAKDENNVRVGVAYTLWHRHDDNPSDVESELERLVRYYMRCKDCNGAVSGYEYRPYDK